MKNDSIDKVVESYFATVTAVPFTYKGKRFDVPELTVSPLILRGFTCPAVCGGCCRNWSLDYLPDEPQPPTTVPREVEFDGRTVVIRSIAADGDPADFCRQLDMETGRCGIHGVHPFTCDFELIRSMRRGSQARLNQQLFTRGWAMRRVDGERGARCTMTPPTPETVADVRRKLRRLKGWADHFGLRTRVPTILAWIDVTAIDFADAAPLRLPA